MDMFVVSMVVGGGGLLSMAIGGLGQHSHGHDGGGGHGGGGHGGGGHAAHGGAAHGHDGGHGGASQGHAAHGHAGGHGHDAAHAHEAGGTHTSQPGGFGHGATWLLSAPRIMFSFLLGLGASGLVLNGMLAGAVLIAAAVAGGILFERFIITPIWNVSMRFASNPAFTLESTLMDEATAVTSFNSNGEGIVSIELNGQIVQILARLRLDDRTLGANVRVGQRVRIEEIDSARNRCTVSVL